MTRTNRWQTFFHALAFVIGFTLVFVALGASVAFFGYALRRYMFVIVKVGGLVLIVFGLQVSGVFGWLGDRVRAAGGANNPLGRAYLAFTDGLGRLLYTEGRAQVKADPSLGYLSSALMGVFFSAGWIPCIGPVLSTIYLMASKTQTVGQGALLLAAYSIGLGLPFLLTGAAFSTMTGWLRRLNRHLGLVSKITGIFLVVMGVLLFMDKLSAIAIFFTRIFGTGLAGVELGSSDLTSAITLPIAFLAGLLSFLSPCVLPLIPAYIGYLGGTALAADTASAARTSR